MVNEVMQCLKVGSNPSPIFWAGKKYTFYSNTSKFEIANVRKIHHTCIIGDPSIYGMKIDKNGIGCIDSQYTENVENARDQGQFGIYVLNIEEANKEFNEYIDKKYGR